MFSSLPENALLFMDWDWSEIEPYYQELIQYPLTDESLKDWLLGWSQLQDLIHERRERHYVATTSNTADEKAEKDYKHFLDEVYPQVRAADQQLKEKLLKSGLQPDGFNIPLRNMRAEAGLFREVNLPLLSEELKLANEYAKIMGAQTVEWKGKEVTIPQLAPVLQEPDREIRESAWRLARKRQLEDREAINALWGKLLKIRRQLAINADLSEYRAYRWQQLLRFDYTPADCDAFRRAIRQVVVPLAASIYEKRRQRLGVKILRPWDLYVDPFGRPPLRPFKETTELDTKTAHIFKQLNPQLGAYYETMQQENLLDLENRKNKAPGAYCTDFPSAKRPFIFMNAVGIHDDVLTIVHESGHAFHVFESSQLPYYHQRQVPWEFSEVASMSMELLTAPYLTDDRGGFYTSQEAAQARVEHLESAILFFPYMAVVDEFQHWVYENDEAAAQPQNCDARWSELWRIYMPGVDWSGLEDEMATGWHRKEHIFEEPFYYVEYGLAQMGAAQVWQKAVDDQESAVAAYRKALALGGTANLPRLFAAAGAKFAFDAGTLHRVANLMEKTIEILEET